MHQHTGVRHGNHKQGETSQYNDALRMTMRDCGEQSGEASHIIIVHRNVRSQVGDGFTSELESITRDRREDHEEKSSSCVWLLSKSAEYRNDCALHYFTEAHGRVK